MRVRIKYITQIDSSPPTFLIFSNRPDGIKRGYIRFLENKIIEQFQIIGSPVKVKMRGRTDA
jgi:GTP-binding protein